MLRVAVVEDETEYRGLIQEMVGRYAKEYDLQIQTTAFPDGRELVQNYHKFDILLMDILISMVWRRLRRYGNWIRR